LAKFHHSVRAVVGIDVEFPAAAEGKRKERKGRKELRKGESGWMGRTVELLRVFIGDCLWKYKEEINDFVRARGTWTANQGATSQRGDPRPPAEIGGESKK